MISPKNFHLKLLIVFFQVGQNTSSLFFSNKHEFYQITILPFFKRALWAISEEQPVRWSSEPRCNVITVFNFREDSLLSFIKNLNPWRLRSVCCDSVSNRYISRYSSQPMPVLSKATLKMASYPLICFEEQAKSSPAGALLQPCCSPRAPKTTSAGWDKLPIHLLESQKSRTVTAEAHNQPPAAAQ